MLEQSTKRPVGMLDNERYAAYSVWCERRILPVICVRSSLVSTSVIFVNENENENGERIR